MAIAVFACCYFTLFNLPSFMTGGPKPKPKKPMPDRLAHAEQQIAVFLKILGMESSSSPGGGKPTDKKSSSASSMPKIPGLPSF